MAGDNMTAKTFLDEMLSDKRISEADYLKMKRLVTAETTISEVTITDNITLKAYCRPSQLEAVSKFFNTAELLEMVLLQVPQQDLLCNVRHVCKGFKIAIDRTPAIQRRLFKEYDVNATAQSPVLLPYRMPRLQKLIEGSFPDIKDYIEIYLLGKGYAGLSSACDGPLSSAQLACPPLPNVFVSTKYYDRANKLMTTTASYELKAKSDTVGVTLGQLHEELKGLKTQMEAKWGRGGFGKWWLICTRHLPYA